MGHHLRESSCSSLPEMAYEKSPSSSFASSFEWSASSATLKAKKAFWFKVPFSKFVSPCVMSLKCHLPTPHRWSQRSASHHKSSNDLQQRIEGLMDRSVRAISGFISALREPSATFRILSTTLSGKERKMIGLWDTERVPISPRRQLTA